CGGGVSGRANSVSGHRGDRSRVPGPDSQPGTTDDCGSVRNRSCLPRGGQTGDRGPLEQTYNRNRLLLIVGASESIGMVFLQNIWWYLVLIGVMILVHELGHYWAARFFDVKVETFSFGFGPRLFGFRRGDTDFRFSAIL